jgi:ribosomal protein S12 methylthiotransferase accessory factor
MVKLKLEGAHRLCTPEETLERMRPFYEMAGITRVADITGLDCSGVNVSQCIRPDAVYLSVDSGKGATKAAARASAVMEGFERHVGESVSVECIQSNGDDLPDSKVNFQLLKGASYSSKVERNWVKVQGIFGKPAYVPLECVSLIPRQPIFPLFHSCFTSTSNGLSSGNSLNEAIAGGLYEVIERDQVALAMSPLSSPPRVSLDSITDPTLLHVVAKLRKNGIFPVIFDCTGDINVPTYVAYVYDSERGTGIYRGYASHLDPLVAQCRAVCEAIQARLVWMSGSRDDFSSEKFLSTKQSDSSQTVAKLLSGKNVTESNRHRDSSCDTFQGDIETLSERLKLAGFNDVYFKEFSHPYPCSVVRVLVSGLSGYFHEYGTVGRNA